MIQLQARLSRLRDLDPHSILADLKDIANTNGMLVISVVGTRQEVLAETSVPQQFLRFWELAFPVLIVSGSVMHECLFGAAVGWSTLCIAGQAQRAEVDWLGRKSDFEDRGVEVWNVELVLDDSASAKLKNFRRKEGGGWRD